MITVHTAERVGRHWKRAVTHCIHGHEFTEANTIWNEEGWRACRACKVERNRKARRKAKG